MLPEERRTVGRFLDQDLQGGLAAQAHGEGEHVVIAAEQEGHETPICSFQVARDPGDGTEKPLLDGFLLFDVVCVML